MKKTIAFLLAFCLSVGLCGCGREEVTINIDNVSDYFAVEQTIEGFEYDGNEYAPGFTAVTFAKATLRIKIYKKFDFEVKDFSFNLGLMAWDNDLWESYDDIKEITLYPDGSYEGTFTVTLKSGAYGLDAPYASFSEPGYSILWGDLTGTILVPKKQFTTLLDF